METPVILQLGSRGGSWVALVIFCCIFAAIIIAVTRRPLRGRLPRTRSRWMVGSLLFGVLTTIFYSLLTGFYEAELRHDRIVLTYLHGTTVEVQLENIAGVRAGPAGKGAWRLYLADAQGVVYESRTGNRKVVEAAAVTLRQHVTRHP